MFLCSLYENWQNCIKFCVKSNHFVTNIDCDYIMLWLLSNTTSATRGAGDAYPSRAPELTLVFVGFVLFVLSFQCSVLCSMFVFCFILLAVVLSVFRLNDFCLPLWYLQIPFRVFSQLKQFPCAMCLLHKQFKLKKTDGLSLNRHFLIQII